MAPAQLLRNLQRNGVFRFTASIDALGVPVHVEVLAGIRFARPTFAVGFSFDRGSFGRLAEKLSGIDVDFLDKFGVELEVVRILCSNTFCFSTLNTNPSQLCHHSKYSSIYHTGTTRVQSGKAFQASYFLYWEIQSFLSQCLFDFLVTELCSEIQLYADFYILLYTFNSSLTDWRIFPPSEWLRISATLCRFRDKVFQGTAS